MLKIENQFEIFKQNVYNFIENNWLCQFIGVNSCAS